MFNYESTPDIKAVTFYYEPTTDFQYAKSIRYFRQPHNLVHFAGSERADRGFNWYVVVQAKLGLLRNSPRSALVQDGGCHSQRQSRGCRGDPQYLWSSLQ